MGTLSFFQRWNPLIENLPVVTLTHHPAIYNKQETETVIYNADDFAESLVGEVERVLRREGQNFCRGRRVCRLLFSRRDDKGLPLNPKCEPSQGINFKVLKFCDTSKDPSSRFIFGNNISHSYRNGRHIIFVVIDGPWLKVMVANGF